MRTKSARFWPQGQEKLGSIIHSIHAQYTYTGPACTAWHCIAMRSDLPFHQSVFAASCALPYMELPGPVCIAKDGVHQLQKKKLRITDDSLALMV